MKTSSKLLLALLMLLLTAAILVDVLLQRAYAKINLADPFKSYEPVAVRPFKYLKMVGGNGYAIEIKQSPMLDMKVMRKRKNFLTMVQTRDTLLIKFTVVSSRSMRDPESLPLGIIISCSTLSGIDATGTNNVLKGWKADSLNLTLHANASMHINGAIIGYLKLSGDQYAIANFSSSNNIQGLDLHLRDQATAYLKEIDYSVLNPTLSGESRLIFGAKAIQNFNSKVIKR